MYADYQAVTKKMQKKCKKMHLKFAYIKKKQYLCIRFRLKNEVQAKTIFESLINQLM